MNTSEQLQRIEAAMKGAAKAPAPVPLEPARLPEPIAIVGLAGYFPGCMSIREFWKALDEERCLLEEIPRNRFDWEGMYDPLGGDPERSRSKWGGFIPDIRSFDPGFFGISTGEAKTMDPRERLLLMAAYHALENAGYAPRSWRGTRTGVFMAGEENEYAALVRERDGGSGAGIDEGANLIASRISHSFDFRGPSEFVNALCAGGAVALNRAVQSLRAGEIAAAVVGAANVILSPAPFIQLSGMNLLSPACAIHSFGRGAQGYLRAEGVACVLLKRLAQAEADGDVIHAVIKNSAVNHNGRGGASRTAPDPFAQAELIRACCEQVGLDPRRLGYIEAQGMGHPLADIAEWRAFGLALKAVAKEQGVVMKPGGCLVGCLKPMLGHMEAASSLGALFKIIRAIQIQTIHGIYGFTEANPELNLDDHPCGLATRAIPWPRTGPPRVAGLNAYGMGGNNAHVLIEEYVRQPGPVRSAPLLALVVLSAPTEAKLAQVAGALLDWIEKHPDQDLADLAYTLQVGRDALDCRLAMVVDSLEQLGSGLACQLTPGSAPPAFVCQGRATHQDATPPPLGDLIAWGRHWAGGGAVSWNDLHRGISVRRISLPEYPFDPCECWVDETTRTLPAPAPGQPLVEQVKARLASMVAEELGCATSEIDPGKHFMDYGIGSLMGLRLAQRLARSFGATVGLQDWLENPTIEAFSQFLTSKVEGQGSSETAARSQDGKGAFSQWECPLSECQRGLWALQKMRPGMAAYNVPIGIRVFQRLDGGQLRKACQALLDRYPLLGCSIRERDGGLVHEPASASFQFEELEMAETGAASIGDLLRDRLRAPFTLEEGPLIRFHLVHCSPKESVVLLVAHHLVMDGLSSGPVMTTLLDAYLACTQGIPFASAPSEVHFGDFVLWEKDQLAGESGKRLESYWKEQLSGLLPTLRLTAEPPAPEGRGGPGELVSVVLPNGLVDGLKALARAHRASLPTVFLGLLQVMLHRYSGEDDVSVGVVAQVRPDDRYANLVGYFINLLPIRTREVSKHNFAGLVRSLQNTLAVGIDHAAYPFPRMVQALGLTPNGESNPIVQAGFEYQSFLPELDWERRYQQCLPVEQLENPRQAGELDLVLEVVELADRMEVHFKYDPSVLGGKFVHRMAEHFLNLAGSVIADPGRRPGGCPMLGENEAAQLLAGWNDTRSEYARTACVHEWIQRQARKTPDAPAVWFEGQSTTYGELDQRSDVLACYLQRLGVRPDQPVALHVNRSPEMVVALLGILKAGGAYLPLDAGCPEERLAFMVRDSGATILLTQSALASRLAFWNVQASAGGNRQTIELDRQWREIADAGQGRTVENRATPDHLAYLIYTSGTTGNPKGVMIPHRALANFLASMEKEPGLGPRDRLLAVTNLSFDIAGLELFLPLVRGAQCWICPAASASNGEQLRETIRRARPTVMQATPSTWKMLLHAGWRNEERARVFCGGEALSEDLARAFMAGGMEAWNLYGPTETTIWSTVQRIEGSLPMGIGRPIANTRIYIVDRYGQPVPVGVAGELLIAGDGLARGYWNRPELTVEKFIELSFMPGERAYRTGDLACWREDGTIKYLGRADHQVKLRGHRIELEEIESHLNRHASVRDSAVVVREHQGAKQLVAYYVPADGKADPGAEQRGAIEVHLRRYLPDYMIPGFFVPLPVVPLTPNGKKDRRSLMARRLEAPAQGGPSSPAAPQEEAILAIWRDVLGVENLRANDALFTVGGDSVSAVMIAERISRTLAVPFTATDIFRCPTARAMAAHVATLQAGAAETASATIPAAASEPPARQAPAPCPEYYQDSIAIIGISCQFPGAETHQAFWANLKSGVHSAVYFSREELRRAGVPEALARNPAFVPVQMTIEGKDCFDPDFFRIPARNAALMDPQCRLLLMHAWKAIEDAGYVPAEVADAAVFTAVSNTFHASARVNADSDLNDGENYVAWLLAQAGTVATMISHQLGLRGPSYAVHANCSSSLVALHTAFQTLRQGDARCALVGAASLVPGSKIGYLFQEGTNLSSDGRCKAFDAAADGMAGGEGVAVLLVKRAGLAVRDGDHIYAIIRGIGVNNDGSDKAGFYAPGLTGQAGVIEKALSAAGVHPETVSYVEAHGTGTKLGDPVEVAALSQAYAAQTERKQYCGIGSVKSNIGHLDTAAGLAGCIKVALSLKHRELPPTLHYRAPNPAIPFADSPFYVVDQWRAWVWADGPRRAGLSSLGLGGTNTHAILEESVVSPITQPGHSAGPFLVVFSARSDDRLREMAANFLKFVREPAEPVSLADLAFTLQVGRLPMPHRLAGVVGTMEELAERLQAWLAGGKTMAGWWAGIAPDEGTLPEIRPDDGVSGESISQWLAERRLPQLAMAWVQGRPVDWKLLHAGPAPKRISLPTYPFARELCRLAAAMPESRAMAGGLPAESRWLHALLHENVSTLNGQRYRTTFTGQEFFLADHVVQGRRMLPGVVCLEIARAAVSQAAGLPSQFRLEHIAWPRPFEVGDQPRSLQIDLRKGQGEEVHFDISTSGQTPDSEMVLLCQGAAVRPKPAAAGASLAVALQAGKYPLRFGARECYAELERLGIAYGPSHQGIVELFAGPDGVLARLSLPGSVSGTLDRFVLHPSLLDAAIHASVGFGLQDRHTTGQEGAFLLPFALQGLEMPGHCSAEMWARITKRNERAAAAETETLDIELCDLDGQIQFRLEGLFSRRAGGLARASVPRAGETWLARPVWVAAEVAGDRARPRFEECHVVVCGLPLQNGSVDLVRNGYRWLEVQTQQECPARRFAAAAEAVFQKVRTILEGKPKGNILLQVVVRQPQDAACLQGLSGLLRTTCLENPAVFAQIIGVDEGTPRQDLPALLLENARCPEAVQIRYRDGKREVLRWDDLPVAEVGARIPWRDGGIYLITGGAGALGLIFAAEIGRRVKNAEVILAGRSEAGPEFGARMKALGVRCVYRRVDVGNAAEVAALISRIKDEVGQLNGVLHAAGIIKDDFILRKSPAQFQQVLAPKVMGAVNLDRALSAAELDFFVVFSSISGILGSAGQADYATANAFLDEFAEYRQGLVSSGLRQGLTLSLNWPLWQEGGMRVEAALVKEMTGRTGFVPLEQGEGLDAFYASMAGHSPRIAVLCGDRERIRAYVDGLASRQPEDLDSGPSAVEDTTRLAASAREWLRRELAAALERPVQRMKDQEKFERYGVDSILAVQLTNRLETSFGSLPKTLFFEYQTVQELAQYFLEKHRDKLRKLTGIQAAATALVPAPPRENPQPAAPTVAPDVNPTDIAIIGLSGRYPQAADLDQFWKNLVEGRDSITEVPASRWDWRKHYTGDAQRPGDHASKWGGFIEDVDLFDPLFFNISPREAGLVDPQERLFLETVWNLLESAGYTKEKLRERHQGRVAVYVGAMYQQYHAIPSDPLSEAIVSLSSFSGIANRVSYFFDFQGPSIAVDTMCSSSLAAIQMACESLRSGLVSMAVAGAVNLTIHPHKFTGLTAAKLMGSHPGSRSFADGDGYLPAEGVGAVLLKPLANAIQDRDPILAVIKAVTASHSGQSGGFGVPNPQAQARAAEDCLRWSGVDPRTIGYVEASANGSPLGDAIEVKALSNALARHIQERGTIPIGSVKANLGHSEAASGMAQLSKVVLQMRHSWLVPAIKAGKTNPNIVFPETPFYLPEQASEWRPPAGMAGDANRTYPRRALISSVGAGGSTGHLILEEYPASQPVAEAAASASGPWLIVLSARNRGRLEAQVRNLGEFLKKVPAIRLAGVAYTLHVGREPMEHRAALIANSLEELVRNLEGLAEHFRNEGQPALNFPVFMGNTEESDPAFRELLSGAAGSMILSEWLAGRVLEKLATYWVRGGDVRWEPLYHGLDPVIVNLPTYPFERRRCWLQETGSTRALEVAPAPERLPQRPITAGTNGLGTFLKAEISTLLGLDPAELPLAKALNSLGFTSIDAVSLKSKLEQEFEVEVPIATLNVYQSINLIETELQPLVGKAVERHLSGNGGNGRKVKMQPVLVANFGDRHQPFPLSDIQESFYLGRKIGGQDRTGCHIYFEIGRQELDVYRLNAAWNRLVQRHDMLRAVILPDGTQRILEETALYRFRTVDLRRLDLKQQADRLGRTREEMSHRIYNPEQWPLFDIQISILPDKRFIHFSIDELIVDALSIDLLFQQWLQFYEDPQLALPRLELSFRDYVLATKGFAESARAQKDLEYWLGKLREMPAGPQLPGFANDQAASRAVPHRCSRLEGRLNAPSWAALKRRAESINVSPTALVLGLFTESLRAQCREKTFSLILTFFNRMPIHPQVDQILGPFISTSIFVAEPPAHESLPDRIRQTQRQLWEDLDHNNVSGIRVLRELKRRRHIPGNMALPVVFTSMLGSRAGMQETLLKDLTFSVTQTPQVYLDHQLYEQAGELHFSWDAAKECFAPGVIDAWFQSYCRFLENAAANDSSWEGSQWQSGLQATGPKPPLQAHPEDRHKPFALTDQQQAYAFGRSKHGSQTPSNVYLDFEAGELEVARLEAAWRRVIEAHPMLAATINANGTQQLLDAAPAYSISVQDLAGLEEDQLAEALAAIEREMMARMCPLNGWPFFELRVSRLRGGQTRVHLCVDMIIADPASIDFIAEELFQAYLDPTKAPAAPEIAFSDYLRYQGAFARNGGQAAAAEYWAGKFSDLPPGPVLPGGAGDSPGITSRRSEMLEGWDRLVGKANELAVRPAMILLAAFAEVLWDRAGRQPFTLVMPCWQRPPVHPEIYRVVGDFTAMCWLPVRRLEGTFQARVIQYHQQVQADLAHSAVSGLKALRKAAAKRKNAGREALRFPVVFTDLSPQPVFRLPEGIRLCRSSSRTSQVHLDNISAEYGDKLGLYWDVAQGVYADGLIEQMFEDYHQILSGLANHEAWWEAKHLLPLVHEASKIRLPGTASAAMLGSVTL